MESPGKDAYTAPGDKRRLLSDSLDDSVDSLGDRNKESSPRGQDARGQSSDNHGSSAFPKAAWKPNRVESSSSSSSSSSSDNKEREVRRDPPAPAWGKDV